MFSRLHNHRPFYQVLVLVPVRVKPLSPGSPPMIPRNCKQEELTQSAAISRDYFMCGNEERVSVAKLIEVLPLTLRERYKFSIAPVRTDDPYLMQQLCKVRPRLCPAFLYATID